MSSTKSKDDILVAMVVFMLIMASITWYSVWRMGCLSEELHNANMERNREWRGWEPSREEITKYIEANNGSSPPANWYPNGDPWRNFTAKEADEWLQYYEDTPDNRRKWAEAGTPMKFEKP